VSKEVFFLLGGLSTQDPSNIFSTVEKSKRRGITIDVVHLAADVYICRYLAERTGGRYGLPSLFIHAMPRIDANLIQRSSLNNKRYVVALNEDHCQKAMKLIADAPPPSVLSARGSRVAIVDGQPAEKPTIPLLLMGFPGPRAPDVTPELGELIRNASEDQVGGLWCPRCYCRVDAIITALHSKFASALDPNDIVLPTNCQACGLLLVKASHLARSYKTMMKPLKMHRVKLSFVIWTAPSDIAFEPKRPNCLRTGTFVRKIHDAPRVHLNFVCK
jgi:transcription initiation factor TFIIH subunit 2